MTCNGHGPVSIIGKGWDCSTAHVQSRMADKKGGGASTCARGACGVNAC